MAINNNAGKIDFAKVILSLHRQSSPAIDFFQICDTFEHILPIAELPLSEVMECTQHLLDEMGQDLGATHILDAFAEYCDKHPNHIRQGTKLIEETGGYADLLVCLLMAGSKRDFAEYFNETRKLAGHKNQTIRQRALFAIGRLNWTNDEPISDALEVLEKAISKESDDRLLAAAMQSIESLQRKNPDFCNEAAGLIDNALLKGGDRVRHAACELLAFHTKELSPEIVSMLQPHLVRVNPEAQATLDLIDLGISNLLKCAHQRAGVELLESFISGNVNGRTFSFDLLDACLYAIMEDEELRNTLVTRWLLSGQFDLCHAVKNIAGKSQKPVLLVAPTAEIAPLTPREVEFLALKAVGFLFMQPVSAASFIISLMCHKSDDDIVPKLGDLLLNPLLINYPGSVRDFIKEKMPDTPKPVSACLSHTLAALDDYLSPLEAMADIKEMQPEIYQREAFHKHQSDMYARSHEAAEKKSLFFLLIHKSRLLYGRRLVSSMTLPNGEVHRNEVELQSYSLRLPFPQRERFDPVGLNHTLRILKLEQLNP